MATKRKARPVVEVEVEAGYEEHSVIIRRDWKKILAGKRCFRVAPIWYDNKKMRGTWGFNYDGYGSLKVSRSEGGTTYIGSMDDAYIWVDSIRFVWPSLPPQDRPISSQVVSDSWEKQLIALDKKLIAMGLTVIVEEPGSGTDEYVATFKQNLPNRNAR